MNEETLFRLPEAFSIDDLGIAINSEGQLYCHYEPIFKVLEFNGIHVRHLVNTPDFKFTFVTALIECYRSHLARGGEPNPILDNFGIKTLGERIANHLDQG